MAVSTPYPVIGTSKNYCTPENNNLIISEIHFSPRQGADYEYIELFNPSGSTIDLAGYWFSRAVDFTFPEDFRIGPKACVVLSRNGELYGNEDYFSVTWNRGKLANEGESVVLHNSDGQLVDYVNYSPIPFPEVAASGNSIELLSPESDNATMPAWQPGLVDGTPGVVNFDLSIQPSVIAEQTGYTFKLASRHASIRFTLPDAGFVNAALYNARGQLVKRFYHEILSGLHPYAITVPFDSYAQGIYVLTFRSSVYSFSRKITIYR